MYRTTEREQGPVRVRTQRAMHSTQRQTGLVQVQTEIGTPTP